MIYSIIFILDDQDARKHHQQLWRVAEFLCRTVAPVIRLWRLKRVGETSLLKLDCVCSSSSICSGTSPGYHMRGFLIPCYWLQVLANHQWCVLCALVWLDHSSCLGGHERWALWPMSWVLSLVFAAFLFVLVLGLNSLWGISFAITLKLFVRIFSTHIIATLFCHV